MDHPSETVVVPDGCMDLIWLDDRLIVAGPDAHAHGGVLAPGEQATGIRLTPGTAPTILGVPASELVDQRVALADLGATRVRGLAQAEPPSRTAVGAWLEDVVASLASDAPNAVLGPPCLAHIVDSLRSGVGVTRLADDLGWSERQLHRLALRHFGYGLRTLGRVLRLQRALALRRAYPHLAELAARAGYADQAHLSREFRALTGMRPSDFTA